MTIDWIDEAVRTFPVRAHTAGDLVPARTALLVVDVQRHWTDPDGPVCTLLRRDFPDLHAYFTARLAGRVLPNLRALLAASRAAGVRPVFVTFGSLLPDGADLTPRRRRRVASHGGTARFAMRAGEPYHAICPDLPVGPDDLVLNKSSSSAFNSTALHQILRNLGVDTVVVAGLVTNGCVELTARDASDLGYETIVAEDASGAYIEEIHRAALVNFARVYGAVRTTADLVGALAARRAPA
jgi:ureidoacrylate peracid hydrolase